MVEVFKFGGTCVESPSKLETVSKIIGNSSKPVVVTVSAAGGVTNQLKQLLEREMTEESIECRMSMPVQPQRHEDTKLKISFLCALVSWWRNSQIERK